MIQIKYVIGIIMLFAILQLVNGVLEMTYLTSEKASVLRMLMDPWPPSFAYLTHMWDALWWNYAHFQPILPDGSDNQWYIVRYVVFIPISIGFVIAVAVTVLQIAGQGIGGILGVFGRG